MHSVLGYYQSMNVLEIALWLAPLRHCNVGQTSGLVNEVDINCDIEQSGLITW